MNNRIDVLDIKTFPILKLLVSRPAATARAAGLPGQTEVESFHITLARLDDLGLTLPKDLHLPPVPTALTLKSEVRLVQSGAKQSCYVEVDEAGQQELARYVQACEAILGLKLHQDERVFHVTLSNAGAGSVRASIGDVWDFRSRIV